MKFRVAACCVLALLFAAGPAAADPESGKGRGKGGWERKEEFWSDGCKIERKWHRNGMYKEERKCKGGHAEHHHHDAPGRRAHAPAVQAPVKATVVYPPWIVVQQGERTYHPQYQPRPVRAAARCNSDMVGRVLGGVIGGALGSQVGKGSGRTAATIGGAVAGVLIGGEIGKRMDANDQACVGQVLEVAPVNHRVRWNEGATEYAVVPGKVVSRRGSYCRPYTMELRIDGQVRRTQGTACRAADGSWVPA